MSVKKKRPQDAQPHQQCVTGDLGFSPTSRNRAIFSEEKTARFAERVPHGIACHFLKEGCLFPGIAFFTTPKEGLPFFATTRSALFRYGKHHWILPDGHRRKITEFATYMPWKMQETHISRFHNAIINILTVSVNVKTTRALTETFSAI